MQRLRVREGVPVDLPVDVAAAVRRRLLHLEAELRPRRPFARVAADSFAVQNLVGAVQITPDLVMDVEPPAAPGQDWSAALFDLLVDERASFSPATSSATLNARTVLPDALGWLFLDQLGRAFRREGPLTLLRSRGAIRPSLSGRLDVTAWLRSRGTHPHLFPQQLTTLTADNEYTGAMAWVAEVLAARAVHPQLRGALRALARDIRPGLPTHGYIDPNVAAKDVPTQWRAYEPAWVTTCAVLRRLSPLQRSGALQGLTLALEPWPLLETLLHRVLRSAAAQGQTAGYNLTASPHTRHALLKTQPPGASGTLGRIHTPRSVEPDGLLNLNGKAVATFEAKYTVPSYESTRPHLFQAITTAAALGAPLAVLVYPEDSAPVRWWTARAGQQPATVAAVGIDMYGYRRGVGDATRGKSILDLVTSLAGIAHSASGGGSVRA